MILIDTSAWVEFLRNTGSEVCTAVDDLLDDDIAVCNAVSMEVLAGARNEQHLAQLRGLLGRSTLLPTAAADYDHAAAVYRACRGRGTTVRKLIDCLIAAVAIRHGAPILHADSDCTGIAEHTSLAVHASSRP